MFKGNRNLAVGLFVSAALAGIAAFSLWLAGTRGSEPMDRYSILFERDISGLSLGGPVYFMGVAVGRVVDIGWLPGDPIRVRVDVEIRSDTPIGAGSSASLMPQGITGINVINIAHEPGRHGPLQPAPGFEYPLIPVRQTGLSALLAQAPDAMSKLNALLDRANLLVSPENIGALTRTLEHMESLSRTLAGDREDLATLPGELRTLMATTRETVDELRTSLREVRPDLRSALAGLDETGANLARLTQRVDSWLTDNEPEFQHFIDNGLGQAPELMLDLRSTLRELQKLLLQLQEDPSQLIHRPPNDALEVEGR